MIEQPKYGTRIDGKLLLTLYGHTIMSPTRRTARMAHALATVSWDRQIKVWDAATGQELFTLPGTVATFLLLPSAQMAPALLPPAVTRLPESGTFLPAASS